MGEKRCLHNCNVARECLISKVFYKKTVYPDGLKLIRYCDDSYFYIGVVIFYQLLVEKKPLVAVVK